MLRIGFATLCSLQGRRRPLLLALAIDFNSDLLNSYDHNAARKNLGSLTKLTLSPETELEKEGV